MFPPLTAWAIDSRISRVASGSNTTGTSHVFGFRAPILRSVRETAFDAISSRGSRSRARMAVEYQYDDWRFPIFSPFSGLSSTAHEMASV